MCVERNESGIKEIWQEDAHGSMQPPLNGKGEKYSTDPEAHVLSMMATWHHLINKGQAQRPLGNLVSFLSPANAPAVIFRQTRPTQRNLPMTLLTQQMLELVLTLARPQPTCSTQRSAPCYSGSLPFLNSKNYQMFRECKLRELSWGARDGRGHLNPLGLFCLYCL